MRGAASQSPPGLASWTTLQQVASHTDSGAMCRLPAASCQLPGAAAQAGVRAGRHAGTLAGGLQAGVCQLRSEGLSIAAVAHAPPPSITANHSQHTVPCSCMENVVKECEEEASIPPELAARAQPVGAVSYTSLQVRSLHGLIGEQQLSLLLASAQCTCRGWGHCAAPLSTSIFQQNPHLKLYIVPMCSQQD